jgi:hypothetical protein
MVSSGMLRRVALVRTDVWEELSASFSVHQLLVTAGVVPSSPILVTLVKEALSSSETSVLKEPHGVTSQMAPFFNVISNYQPSTRRRNTNYMS